MSDFEKVIADALKLYSWRYVHFRAAKTAKGWRTPFSGYKGFPDFVATRGERLLFIEVKGDTGYPDVEQRAWREALTDTGATYILARPKTWEIVHGYLLPMGVEVLDAC